MRGCPYPHENGAHVQPAIAPETHNEPAISHCAETHCSQPVFRCAACRSTNRTLAKFCRNCRQPLAFEETLAQWHAGLEIRQQDLITGARLLPLSGLQGAALTALENAWGYFVFAATGWGVGVMSNTALNPPRLLFKYALTGSEPITALRCFAPAREGPAVLAIGRHALHAVTLLPRWEGKQIFRVSEPGWEIAEALPMQTRFVIRLHHAKTKNHRWLVLESVHEPPRELSLPARGALSAMLAIPEAGRFFFASEAEIVQYDLPDQKEHRFAAPNYGLNVKVAPCLHAHTGEIIWQGLDGFIYRCTVHSHKARFKPFGATRYEILHFFNTAHESALHVLTRDNVITFDYPGGAELWNFSRAVKTRIQCGTAAPRAFGKHMLFAFRSASLHSMEERVGVLSLTERRPPMLLHPELATMPMPVAGVSNLMGARQARLSAERGKSAFLLFQV